MLPRGAKSRPGDTPVIHRIRAQQDPRVGAAQSQGQWPVTTAGGPRGQRERWQSGRPRPVKAAHLHSGFVLYLACCFLPAALYVTQPDRFLALALIGVFAAVVVLLPVGKRR